MHENQSNCERVAQLTDGQKQCLRLVFRGFNSKEIARQLNISRFTVDQRVARAGAVLQVASRRQAARILSECEQVVYEPIDIPKSSKTDESSCVVTYLDDGTSDQHGNELQDYSVTRFGNESFSTKPLNVPIPRFKGDRYEATSSQKLQWIFIISVASILTTAMLISALETLGRLVSEN